MDAVTFVRQSISQHIANSMSHAPRFLNSNLHQLRSKLATILLLIFLAFPLISFAEPTYYLFSHPGQLKLDYTQAPMPNGQASMGLVGVHYDAFATPWLYGGLAGYSAILGQNGGFMAMAVEAGLTHTLFGNISGDIGIDYGAGGGGNAAVGSGSFIQPYAGFSYNFQPIKVGLEYHYLNFFNGRIKSNAIAIFVSMPLDLHSASSSYNGVTFDQTIQDNFKGGAPYASHDFIALVFDNYFPRNGTHNTQGQRQDQMMGLVGAKYGHYFDDQIFSYVQTDGAYKGGASGYTDLFAGLGWSLPLIPGLINLQPQAAFGSGGGGLVDTNGGLLLNAGLGLQFLLSDHFAFELNGNYIKAQQGKFKAFNIGGSLVYLMDLGSYNLLSDNAALSQAYFQGWKIRIGNQTIFDARRTNGQKRTLNVMTTDLNFMLGRFGFLAGQIGMSRTGGAGGYKTGMLGVGVTTNTPVGLYGEILVGSAGGGGVDTHDGLVAMPEVGVYADLNHLWSIHASYGRIKALHGGGELNSNLMSLGVSYRFSTLMGWR